MSVLFQCICLGCGTQRPKELTRGHEPFMVDAGSGDGQRYSYRVPERCECGDDRVQLRVSFDVEQKAQERERKRKRDREKRF